MKNYVSLLGLLLLLFCLMNCKKDDVLKNNTPPDEEPDTTNGDTILAERRVEIFESINVFLNDLSWNDRAKAQSAIVAHLKKIPEFKKVEYDETSDNIIAQFTDGAIYMMVNNRNTDKDIPEPDYGKLKQTSSSQRTTAYEYPAIPESSNVYIFKGVGNYFKSSYIGTPFYKFLFDFEKQKTGYKATIVDATINNLKDIKDAGVFYYCSHGGMGRFKDNPKDSIYGSWTTEKVTVDLEKKYRKEIKAGELVYMDAYDRHENGKKVAETHFAITAKFVDKYMSFPKNSLIYLDLCQSFRVKDYWWAFHSKSQGTGTVIGWSDNVGDDDAHKATSFVFDRLLGVNLQGYPVIPHETPKQRSFDFPSVYKDMVKRNLVESTPYSSRPYQVAFLKYQEGPNKDIVLRPSISYMQVYEYFDWLFIYGLFGEDPGAGKRFVTIDGETTEILEWTPQMIKCKIKSSGKGSAGEVIVKVKGNESRPRILTEWRGELLYKRPSAGSYMEEVTLKIHLRRDIAQYRKGAGLKPEKIDASPFTGPARDSKAIYKFGGSAKYVNKDENCTYTYYANWISQQGEIGLYDINKPNQEGVLLISTEKTNGFELSGLNFIAVKPSQNSVYNDWACSSSSGTSDKAYDNMTLENPGKSFLLFNFQFDQDFTIKAGKVEGKGLDRSEIEYADGNIPEFGITLEWKAIKPNFLPKSDYAL
ncbi:IPT/TIG domain-containing protein [Xanthocytophaga agilis]|uniref:IPT/TIG domain-containing protein n=1 Tax=Xanthocytophaga agilis TaxID=3048010 RepID=A0AAE3R8Q0_9BACT|nr:IPT/TIG domain-containing protein [Xanthocytophaga agilis]MDJ1505716.1 IPT/TIG domain-containing protein [Xanthocytophaga agilis]